MEYKINHAKEFLGKSYKLKVSLQFRGREMAHKELGFELIKNVITELEDYGQADSPPKIIGRSIITTISPLSAKNQRARAKARELAASNTGGYPVEHEEALETEESAEHNTEEME
jgi:translation initiation factor IF-3